MIKLSHEKADSAYNEILGDETRDLPVIIHEYIEGNVSQEKRKKIYIHTT